MKVIVWILVVTITLIALPLRMECSDEGPEYGIYLFRQGKDELAIPELERTLYYHESAPDAPYLKLLLGLSYARSGQYGSALSLLSALVEELEDTPHGIRKEKLSCETTFHILNIYFRQKRFTDFYYGREQLALRCPELDTALASSVQYMSIAGHIYTFDWKAALGELEMSPLQSTDFLKEQIEPLVGYRSKSPVLGGILSIIPGLGHVYAGRFGDGIRSLLINIAFVSLSYFSFKEDMPALGAVFGVIEASLYAANIYGGVNAVNQENARFFIEKRESILKQIPVPPLDIITLRKELDF